jgi:hypothetical protein
LYQFECELVLQCTERFVMAPEREQPVAEIVRRPVSCLVSQSRAGGAFRAVSGCKNCRAKGQARSAPFNGQHGLLFRGSDGVEVLRY